MSWNYRIIHDLIPETGGDIYWIGVVHYDYPPSIYLPDRVDKPHALWDEPLDIAGPDIGELRSEIEKIQRALDKPALEYRDLPRRYRESPGGTDVR